MRWVLNSISPLKIIRKSARLKNITKIVRPFFEATDMNGLNCVVPAFK